MIASPVKCSQNSRFTVRPKIGFHPLGLLQPTMCWQLNITMNSFSPPDLPSADTVCYPLRRSHPLRGTLWLWGPDGGRPQLQERRKVPDYQQRVSHYGSLSNCPALGRNVEFLFLLNVLKKLVLLGVEQTGRWISLEVKVAAGTLKRGVLVD